MFDSKVTLEHLIWQEAELTAYNRRVSVRSKTACYIRPWSACRELLRYAHQVVKMSLLTALFFKLTPDFVTSWKCSAFFAYTGIRASDRRQTFFPPCFAKGLSAVVTHSVWVWGRDRALFVLYLWTVHQKVNLSLKLHFIIKLTVCTFILISSSSSGYGNVMWSIWQNRVPWLLVQRGQNSSNTVYGTTSLLGQQIVAFISIIMKHITIWNGAK